MKKLLWLILLLGGYAAVSAHAQIRKVPARVTNSMHAIYPNATNVEWRDKFTAYQANFDLSGTRCEAKFNRRGHWKRTEMTVAENSFPDRVKDGFRKSKYGGWQVRSSYVTYLPGQRTRYHMKVARNDLTKKELVFNTQGRLLKDNMTI